MIKQEFHVEDAISHNQSSPLRWIISHIWQHNLFLISFVAGIVLANILNGYIPIMTGRAFDTVLEAPTGAQAAEIMAAIGRIALTILAAVLVRAVADIVGQYSMEVIAKRLERDSRDELYLNLLGKSQTFHNQQRVGDIMARANNDVRELDSMMMPGFSLMFDSLMGLLLPIIYISLLNVELLLAPLLFAVAFAFALRRFVQELTPVSGDLRYRFGMMNAMLAESITGIEVVKTSVQETQEVGKFGQTARAFRDAFVEQGRIQARYLPPFILGLTIAIGFMHALWIYGRGDLSIGEIVTYLGLLFLLRFPTSISIFTFTLMRLGIASAERILDLMQQESEIDENQAGHAAPMKGDIVFDKVSFGYGDKLILEDISFTAAPGETIAIVGQTGSGKSTLTKLVNRIYDIRSGRVLIDGIEIKDWQLSSLREQISTIEQDIVLFSRPIADNIAFGQGQNVSQAEIEAAAKEAQAHEFIMNFKDGYQTQVGERGVTLSGGQRQRLAIARALLTDPRILILDDATSAIDSATEDRIQHAINRVMDGRTTLLITHRLSQIRRADKIIVLQHGRILDQGSHTELLARCTLYQRIFGQKITK